MATSKFSKELLKKWHECVFQVWVNRRMCPHCRAACWPCKVAHACHCVACRCQQWPNMERLNATTAQNKHTSCTQYRQSPTFTAYVKRATIKCVGVKWLHFIRKKKQQQKLKWRRILDLLFVFMHHSSWPLPNTCSDAHTLNHTISAIPVAHYFGFHGNTPQHLCHRGKTQRKRDCDVWEDQRYELMSEKMMNKMEWDGWRLTKRKGGKRKEQIKVE